MDSIIILFRLFATNGTSFLQLHGHCPLKLPSCWRWLSQVICFSVLQVYSLDTWTLAVDNIYRDMQCPLFPSLATFSYWGKPQTMPKKAFNCLQTWVGLLFICQYLPSHTTASMPFQNFISAKLACNDFTERKAFLSSERHPGFEQYNTTQPNATQHNMVLENMKHNKARRLDFLDTWKHRQLIPLHKK